MSTDVIECATDNAVVATHKEQNLVPNGGAHHVLSRGARAIVQRLCRLYPFLSGCTQIANHRLLQHLTKQDEIIDCRLQDGSLMRLQLNDYGGRAMFYFGDYDPKITVLLRRLLRPGDTVIDIGANFGLISLMAARLVGTNGKVHAFEPQTQLAEFLQYSAHANGYTNLVVHPVGLSDADGDMMMFVQPGITGAASLVRSDLPAQSKSTVRVVDSGPYLKNLELSSVRLLKIDVEGHEHAVLSSAKEYLQQVQPEAILFETQDYHISLQARPTVKLLESLDYQFFPIGKSVLRLKLKHESAMPEIIRDSAHDVLAIHRSSKIAI